MVLPSALRLLVDQVWPPSRLKRPTLLIVSDENKLRGLVGLIAIVDSASLPAALVTLTFEWTAVRVGDPSNVGTTVSRARPSRVSNVLCRRRLPRARPV